MGGESSLDPYIYPYDLPTRKKLQRVQGHHGLVSALAYTRDGRYMASASGDGTVLIWDVSYLLRR